MPTTTSARRSAASGRPLAGRADRPASTRRASRRSSTSTAARATPCPPRSSAGRRPCPDRVVGVRRARLRRAGRADPAFGETEAAALRDSAARGARGLKVWKLLGLRARDPDGRLVAVDDPRLDPLWAHRRRPRPAGRHPHRRPDRVLRAARRDERALGGAPRPPGLALLADPAGRRPRRCRASRRSTSCSRRSGGSSRAIPRTTFVGAHVGCAAEDLGARRPAARREPEPQRRHRRAARRARPPAVHRPRVLPALRGPDPVRRGHGARIPTCTRSTTGSSRRSTSRSTTARTPVPGQGRWQIHGIGLPDDVLRKVYRDNARRILRLGPVVTGRRPRRPYRARDPARARRLRVRRAARSPSSPSTTARTCARELRPDDPAVGHVRRDGRVQARRRPGPGAGRDRDAARPRDRCRPVHRRRVAARLGAGLHRRDRGDRLRRARRRRGSAGCSTAGASRRRSGSGASAAKLLVYYHPDAPNAADQERLVADVAADCRAADLALFVEPLSFSLVEGEPLTGEARRRVVVETARRLTAIGGDILKAEFPYDPSVDGPRPLARGLRGARRGLGRAVGAAVGRRRRGDVRGAGRDRVRGRRERGSSRAGRSGWAGAAADGRARTRRVAGDDRARPAPPPGRSRRCAGRPWHERRRPADQAPDAGRRLVPGVPGPCR